MRHPADSAGVSQASGLHASVWTQWTAVLAFTYIPLPCCPLCSCSNIVEPVPQETESIIWAFAKLGEVLNSDLRAMLQLLAQQALTGIQESASVPLLQLLHIVQGYSPVVCMQSPAGDGTVAMLTCMPDQSKGASTMQQSTSELFAGLSSVAAAHDCHE